MTGSPRRGRPPELTPAMRMRLSRFLDGRLPKDYGIPGKLWTRAAVAALVAKKFGLTYARSSVGRVLAALGLARDLASAAGRPQDARASHAVAVVGHATGVALLRPGGAFFWSSDVDSDAALERLAHAADIAIRRYRGTRTLLVAQSLLARAPRLASIVPHGAELRVFAG